MSATAAFVRKRAASKYPAAYLVPHVYQRHAGNATSSKSQSLVETHSESSTSLKFTVYGLVYAAYHQPTTATGQSVIPFSIRSAVQVHAGQPSFSCVTMFSPSFSHETRMSVVSTYVAAEPPGLPNRSGSWCLSKWASCPNTFACPSLPVQPPRLSVWYSRTWQPVRTKPQARFVTFLSGLSMFHSTTASQASADSQQGRLAVQTPQLEINLIVRCMYAVDSGC